MHFAALGPVTVMILTSLTFDKRAFGLASRDALIARIIAVPTARLALENTRAFFLRAERLLAGVTKLKREFASVVAIIKAKDVVA